MHPRLLHRDGPHARRNAPLGQIAIADHLAMAGGIAAVLVPVHPVADFGLDGLGQQSSSALAEDVRQDIGGLGQWHDPNFVARLLHGGVLLCRVGTLVDSDTPRVRRLFSSNYPQHSIIPRPADRL